MAGDRRADLNAVFEKLSKDGEEPEITEAPEVEAAPEPEEKPAEVEAAAEVEAPKDETAEQKAKRERDDKGRFAPKTEEAKPDKAPKALKSEKTSPAAAKPTEPAKPAAAAPQPQAVRAPQSLRAAAREAWSKAPPEMRPLLEDVARLEGEAKRVLQENAGLRHQVEEVGKYRESVEGFVRPFDGIFRAQGFQNSMDGVASVVNTYAALHYAAPQQKAAILWNLINQFSSEQDMNSYAEAVAQGRAPQPQAASQQVRPPPQATQPQPMDPRALIREEFQNLQQAAALAREEKNYDTFLAGNPEFIEYPGVQDQMQTILDSAATRGRNLTYQQAYDLALKMDAEIQGILEQREAAARASLPSATAPTARARAAAATVRSKPAGAVGEQADPKDRRALLEANFRRSASR